MKFLVVHTYLEEDVYPKILSQTLCDDFDSAKHLVNTQVNSERDTLQFDEHLHPYVYENDNNTYVWTLEKEAYDWWHIYFIEE